MTLIYATKKIFVLWVSILLTNMFILLANARPHIGYGLAFKPRHQQVCMQKSCIHPEILLRGGSSSEEEGTISEEEDDDDDIIEEEEEEDEDETEEEEDVEDEYEDENYDFEDAESDLATEKSIEEGFVEPYVISPQLQLYTMFGSMILAKRIDLFNPFVVRLLRLLFIVQLLAQQAFIFYIRVMAKKNNDRTPLTIQNPLTDMIEKQMGAAEGNSDMVKNLANSFLSSETTVMEYDMKQASSMQGGLMFNLAFNWFLHFKLGQVQPLLMQLINGTMQLVYNPLFQVYILGRNLERPFKTQTSAAQKLMEQAQQQQEKQTAAEEGNEDEDGDEEDEDEDDDEDEDEGYDEDEDEDDVESDDEDDVKLDDEDEDEDEDESDEANE